MYTCVIFCLSFFIPFIFRFNVPFKADPLTTSSKDILSTIDHSFFSSVPVRRRLLLRYCLARLDGFESLPYEITGSLDELEFDGCIVKAERSIVVFDFQCLVYTSPNAWTNLSNAVNVQESHHDRFLIAHALSSLALVNFGSGAISWFSIMENSPTSSESDKSEFSTELKLLSLCSTCFSESELQLIWESLMNEEGRCASLLNSVLSSQNISREEMY